MSDPIMQWRERIRCRARQTGVDLPPETIEELAVHLEDLRDAARRRGASDDEARAKALDALNESTFFPLGRHASRAARAPHVRDASDTAAANRRKSLAVFYTLRLALRQLRQHRAFALATILVLGLGTGAAAAVYTIVDTVVLRPLPYRAPEELVTIWDTNPSKGLDHERISPVTFMDERRLPAFVDAAAWWRPDVNLVDPGLDPIRVNTVETSPNVFTVLGVSPELGAGFPAGGPFFSRELVCVISDRLWRARYGADAAVIGRQLKLNGQDYTVVGVMPRGFTFPDDIDIWQRAAWDFTQHTRSAHFMEAVARLAPGATLSDATTQIEALSTRLGKQFPSTNSGWNVRLVPLLEQQLGYYRPALLVLFGAVGLLLVIACLNVASLLLTRALSREREVAVRVAIGATPRHIVLQLLAESLVLAAAGAVVGLVSAAATTPLVVRFSPVNIPRLEDATVNLHVLGFGLIVVVGATLLFGLVPSLVLLKRGLAGGLHEGGRGSTRGARRLYITLVSGEIALAVALLLGSALLVRTVRQMTNVPLGVDRDGALLANVQLASNGFPTWTTVAQAHAALLDRIRQEPGVVAAGFTNRLPTDPGWRIPFSIVGQPAARTQELPQAQIITISDGYFRAMGARLQSGRSFTPHDDASSEPVVIVNESFAKRYLSDRPAVGQLVTSYSYAIGPLGQTLVQALPPQGQPIQYKPLRVVGVVADVRDAPLGQADEPAIYMPDRQYPFRAVTFAIAARDRQMAEAAFRVALHDVAPNVPPGTPETWAEHMRGETAEPRLLMSVLLFFGALAGLLAVIGVYGLVSWSVALRRRELAIRLALGARPAGIGGLVVRQAAVMVGAGLIGGWILVRLAQGALSRVLFQVSAGDAIASIGAGLVMILAAGVAVLPAALQAMRLDPTDGLRTE